jgi:hypothetical protein
MCSRWEAASVRARRAKEHSYWLGAAVQLPLALDRSYKTGYGSTYRSGTARRDQEASAGSGYPAPHTTAKLRIVWGGSIMRDRYEEIE